LGFGVYQIPDAEECERSVYEALQTGYRLIDLIVHNEVVPTVNQVETHPFNQQVEAQQFMRENNVQLESTGVEAPPKT
jgi:diketogulonate reductase-like aldo/keto reductase